MIRAILDAVVALICATLAAGFLVAVIWGIGTGFFATLY